MITRKIICKNSSDLDNIEPTGIVNIIYSTKLTRIVIEANSNISNKISKLFIELAFIFPRYLVKFYLNFFLNLLKFFKKFSQNLLKINLKFS